jgi:hypothetical protein
MPAEDIVAAPAADPHGSALGMGTLPLALAGRPESSRPFWDCGACAR